MENDEAQEDTIIEQEQSAEEEAPVEEEAPLWRRLLPYAIQIIFPFVLYYVVTMTSQPQQHRFPKNMAVQEDEF